MSADQNEGAPFSPIENKVMAALENVIDPELWIDLVNLVDGITECDINLVWEPAWDMSKMSRFAKIALGIHG